MLTPYDWQEGVANRAHYIEARLKQGAPVVAISLAEGVLIFSYRRESPKIYEVYDRLGFGGLGLQSDVDSIRNAAVEFASREGYQRSEQDVTIQRVATVICRPVKTAFSDFGSGPFIARTLFAEVNDTPAEDLYYTIDFTGDYSLSKDFAVVAGSESQAETISKALASRPQSYKAERMLKWFQDEWPNWTLEGDEPMASDLSPEAVLIRRDSSFENRFKSLTESF